ncbi:MAG: cell wall metabolism sensor histidine kinase WalK [Leptolyngbya sp. SIO4C1]|nr:cell wall metabolism sensor histidine kinase WalK [Leptolyngbya sp. SIO4C1]
MKLRAKILAGYGISLTLIVLVGSWGVINLWRLGRASDAILRENYRSIQAADGMLDALERQDSATLMVLLGNQPQGMALFREYEIEFLQWLGRANDNITLTREPETLEAIETRYQTYLELVSRLQAQRSDRTLTALYETDVQPSFQLVREATTDLRQINQAAMIAASQRAEQTSSSAIASMALAGGSAAALGLLLSWILSKQLIRPLKSMTQAAEQIASGDYEVQLSVTSNDELGQLASEINLMSQRLQEFRALNLDQIFTEKQRSEAILNSLSDGIVVVDDQFLVTAINPVAARLLNTTQARSQGHHFLEAGCEAPEGVVRSLFEQIQTLAETGQSPAEETDTIAFKQSNSEQHYRYSTTLVRTSDDRRLGVVLLLQDVTKFKQLDQLKSEFVMTASHELRTPLTGMGMSIDLLLESAQAKLSSREGELLLAAQEDVQRLRSLVNELLDLSKIESGRIEMQTAPTAAATLVTKAVELFEVQAADKQIQIQTRVSDQLPLVHADPSKITWVLTNLLANALRYAEAQIEIVAKSHGTWVSFAVTDDGPGIAPAQQSRIFEKFVQVETERDVGGTGLGLAICKEIVKAHGGTIWVDSTPGQGSTFSFTLPIVSQVSSPGALAHA